MYSVLKYQTNVNGKMSTLGIPVVLKVDQMQLSVNTLDYLQQLEVVDLLDGPVFVSKMNMIACKYKRMCEQRRFQLLLHKSDAEQVLLMLKNIPSVHWKEKSGISQVEYSQPMNYSQTVNYSQPMNYSQQMAVPIMPVIPVEKVDQTCQTQVQMDEFNPEWLEYLDEPEFLEHVNRIMDFYECLLYICQ